MKEITLTQGQIEDGYSMVDEAAAWAFGGDSSLPAHDITAEGDAIGDNTESYSEHFVPQDVEVPRPAYSAFETFVELENQLDKHDTIYDDSGRLIIDGNRLHLLDGHRGMADGFAGLRGFASFWLKTANGNKLIGGPAIALPDRRLAILLARPTDGTLSDQLHLDLEKEYVKDRAPIGQAHSEDDNANAGAVAPGLMVATSGFGADVHGEMHDLGSASLPDGSVSTIQTFGAKFARDGREDIQVGHQTLRQLPKIVGHDDVNSFHVGERDQLPPDTNLLGLELPAGKLVVAATMAAATSRNNLSADAQSARLRQNFTHMVEAWAADA